MSARGSRAALAGAALVVGLLTWLASHVLSSAVFEHTHAVEVAHPHDDGIGHVGTSAAAFALLCGLAALMGRRSGRRDVLADAAAFAVLTPVAFLGVEFVQHLIAGDAAPPAVFLAIGVAVHAALGATVPLLWNTFVRDVVRAVLILVPAMPTTDQPGAVDAEKRTWAASRPPGPRGTRGPPSDAHSPIAALA